MFLKTIYNVKSNKMENYFENSTAFLLLIVKWVVLLLLLVFFFCSKYANSVCTGGRQICITEFVIKYNRPLKKDIAVI